MTSRERVLVAEAHETPARVAMDFDVLFKNGKPVGRHILPTSVHILDDAPPKGGEVGQP